MRKTDLRISDAMKRLADSIYEKRADEIDRLYSHITTNELSFPMDCTPKMRQPVRVIPVECFAARTLLAAGSREPSAAASDYRPLQENG